MLLTHGGVELMYSNCNNSRDVTEIGFLWPNNEQRKREVAPGLYAIDFTVSSLMTAKTELLTDPRRNVRCVYVVAPRVI